MATAPTTGLAIGEQAQAAVVHYVQNALDMYTSSYNIRAQLTMRDLAYYRTKDMTKDQVLGKAYNDAGDANKLQNQTVPVVMPQVEAALGYLTGVFLTGYPIFGVVAGKESADAAGQMETVIGENSIRAGWVPNLMRTLRNGLKYDLGACEVVWEKKKIFNIQSPKLDKIQNGTPTETMYEGNFIKDLDPYNLILDTRVDPTVNHIQGEYAGYTELLSMIEVKKRMEDLDPLATMNFKKAFESAGPGMAPIAQNSPGFFIPQINPDALLPVESRGQMNWLNWAQLTPREGQRIDYKSNYEWTVLYARILPSLFGIRTANANHVQIWKFILINRTVCIFAERQTNAHNYLPIIVAKPTNDGLSWQSKSFAENAIPYQDLASALSNSAIESQRRKVYDRMFYDPTRVNKKDIDKVSSVSRIPVKMTAYGKSVADAVHVVPYRDDGVAEILQMSQQVAQNADIANGQNRVSQGQFQKGNKTRREFDNTMQNQSMRTQMMALGLEFSFFTPIKEIIKSNILQYQPPVTLLNTDTTKEVKVDPAQLRKMLMSFKLSDGLLPSEKLGGLEEMQLVFQAAPGMPMLNVEYDIMGMFVYWMKMQGAHWMTEFKRTPQQQTAMIEQTQAAAQAAGNANPPPAAPAAPPPGA